MVVLLMVSFVAGDDPEDADFDPEYGAMTSHKSNKVIKYFFFLLTETFILVVTT